MQLAISYIHTDFESAKHSICLFLTGTQELLWNWGGGELLGQVVSQNLPPPSPPQKKSQRIAESNACLLTTNYLANADAYKFMQGYSLIDKTDKTAPRCNICNLRAICLSNMHLPCMCYPCSHHPNAVQWAHTRDDVHRARICWGVEGWWIE